MGGLLRSTGPRCSSLCRSRVDALRARARRPLPAPRGGRRGVVRQRLRDRGPRRGPDQASAPAACLLRERQADGRRTPPARDDARDLTSALRSLDNPIVPDTPATNGRSGYSERLRLAAFTLPALL